MNDKVCKEHSGCMARIRSLEARGNKWDKITETINKKINVLLGSLLVCALGLVGNLVVFFVKNGIAG